jgi:hypothetical protein
VGTETYNGTLGPTTHRIMQPITPVPIKAMYSHATEWCPSEIESKKECINLLVPKATMKIGKHAIPKQPTRH